MAGIEEADLTITTVSSGFGLPTTDASGFDWVPLPTSFTFPSICTDEWRFSRPGLAAYPDLWNSLPRTCYPGSSNTFSPGACLSNYRMVKIEELRTSGWTSGGQRVWSAKCCRDDTIPTSPQVPGCSAAFSTTVTAYLPDWSYSPYTYTNGEVETFISLDQEAKDNTTVVSTGSKGMVPMFVYWQESDLSNFDPDYAATLAKKLDIDFTPTPTAAVTAETAAPPDRSEVASATPTALSGPNGSAALSDSGLSDGAKAGIGVGVAIGVIALGVAAFLLYKRLMRKKSKLDRSSAIQNEQPEFVRSQMQAA